MAKLQHLRNLHNNSATRRILQQRVQTNANGKVSTS